MKAIFHSEVNITHPYNFSFKKRITVHKVMIIFKTHEIKVLHLIKEKNLIKLKKNKVFMRKKRFE